MSTLQVTTQLVRLVNSNPAPGSLPNKLDTITTSSDLMYQATQVVGTSAEALAYGDVTDECLGVFINDDDTNYVEIGTGAFTPLIKIMPGQRAILPRISSLAAVVLRANTASVNVTVALYKVT